MFEKNETPLSTPYLPLAWQDRPEHVRKGIDKFWNQLKDRSNNSWIYNGGMRPYFLCEIDEYLLLKTMILDNPHQKEFYVLDIGAGDFGFINYLSSQLNKDPDIPKDIKVHLIGLRGEKSDLAEQIAKDICILHCLGSFKVENMIQVFADKGISQLDNKFDLIVSRWCFKHLFDPLGTFLQAFSLLKPEGYLLMDGFFYVRSGKFEELLSEDREGNMERLLLESKVPFLISTHKNTDASSLNQFLIRKPSHIANLAIPLSYSGTHQKLSGGWVAVNFNSLSPAVENKLYDGWELFGKYSTPYNHCSLLGSQELYKALAPKNVFREEGAFGQFEGKYRFFTDPRLSRYGLKIKTQKNDCLYEVDFVEFQKGWNTAMHPSMSHLISTQGNPIFDDRNKIKADPPHVQESQMLQIR